MAGNFDCNICGKQFMSENALYDHNKGVHNEVESPCTQCDKAFRSKVKKNQWVGMSVLTLTFTFQVVFSIPRLKISGWG